jgi:hypothetical protein
MFSFLTDSRPQPGDAQKHLLWIDRVGCWMLMLKDRVTIGGPGSVKPGSANSEHADIPLLAQLSRKHATLERDGENYVLQAHSPVSISGRAIHDKIDLHDGYELQLGSTVRLKFRLPTVMSGSARIEFASDHRPKHAVDGVVLMDETCLLGPHDDNHIRCPGWSNNVVLYRKGDQLWCKSREELFIGGKRASPAGMVPTGAVVQGADFRFRIEPLM